MVITKGAGRIAEVGARFTLDAMPGKQMAIDADLNAGLIGEDEARKRRTEVAQEADFYGSMDGASKFVRGDAVAGILIMVINIIGGLRGRHGAARAGFLHRRQDLHAAGHRRRPGGADPGAGDLDRGRRDRLARGHRRRHRPPAHRPALLQPAGAVPHGRDHRPDGADPRHAEPGLPAARGRAGLAWPAALAACAAEGRRAGRRGGAGDGDAGRPNRPKPPGTTWRWSIRSAWKWATA